MSITARESDLDLIRRSPYRPAASENAASKGLTEDRTRSLAHRIRNFLLHGRQPQKTLSKVTDKDGVSPDRLSAALRITKSELAAAAGLSRDAVSKSSRFGSLSTQTRLREMSEIINRVIPWAGNAWYRSQPLPSLGDATAEELVRQGRAELVRGYLARIAQGGFA